MPLVDESHHRHFLYGSGTVLINQYYFSPSSSGLVLLNYSLEIGRTNYESICLINMSFNSPKLLPQFSEKLVPFSVFYKVQELDSLDLLCEIFLALSYVIKFLLAFSSF